MLIFIVFLILGFLVYKKFSKTKSRLFHSHHLISNAEIKNIELLPCLRIPLGRGRFGERRHLHIHHWIYLGITFTASLLVNNSILGELSFINGFCLGGIIQGLTYRDRFKLKE